MADPTPFIIDRTVVTLIIEGLLIVVGGLVVWIFKSAIKTINEKIDEHKTDSDERIKELKGKVESVSSDSHDTRVTLASNYVLKIEFGRLVDALFGRFDEMSGKIDAVKDRVDEKFDKLNEKIDTKQDKPNNG